jgi:hypothetical protein
MAQHAIWLEPGIDALGILMIVISFPMAWIVKRNPEVQSVGTIKRTKNSP